MGFSDKTGKESMRSISARAKETYRRQRFLQMANAAFAALRTDPEEWKAEMEEREVWDASLSDDLEDGMDS